MKFEIDNLKFKISPWQEKKRRQEKKEKKGGCLPVEISIPSHMHAFRMRPVCVCKLAVARL